MKAPHDGRVENERSKENRTAQYQKKQHGGLKGSS